MNLVSPNVFISVDFPIIGDNSLSSLHQDCCLAELIRLLLDWRFTVNLLHISPISDFIHRLFFTGRRTNIVIYTSKTPFLLFPEFSALIFIYCFYSKLLYSFVKVILVPILKAVISHIKVDMTVTYKHLHHSTCQFPQTIHGHIFAKTHSNVHLD